MLRERVAGALQFVLTLTTYADYIREDELAAPKVGRGVGSASTSTDKVIDVERKAR